MLAGTIYFYNDKEELMKEIDVEEYDDLSEEEFKQMIDDIGASKVTLRAYYHNNHHGTVTVLYPQEEKQT